MSTNVVIKKAVHVLNLAIRTYIQLVGVYKGLNKGCYSSEVVLSQELEVDLLESGLLPYGTRGQQVKSFCILCLREYNVTYYTGRLECVYIILCTL